jgi:hypothetical protein
MSVLVNWSAGSLKEVEIIQKKGITIRRAPTAKRA